MEISVLYCISSLPVFQQFDYEYLTSLFVTFV